MYWLSQPKQQKEQTHVEMLAVSADPDDGSFQGLLISSVLHTLKSV